MRKQLKELNENILPAVQLLLMLLFIPFCSFSQTDSISTSEYYPSVKSINNYYVNKNDDVLYLKRTNENIVLQKFNLIQNRIVETKYLSPLNKNEKVEKILKLGDKYFLFYSFWDNVNKLEQLFSVEIDFENLVLKPKRKIIEINRKLKGKLVYYGSFKIKTEEKYHFSISKNTQNLLISCQIKPVPLQENNREYCAEFGLFKFDENLKKTESFYSMPSSYIMSSYYDFLITNKNEVYILSDVYETEEFYHYVGKEKNYHIELLKISESKIDKILISEKTYYIKDLRLIEGIENEVIIAGYYLEKGFLDNVDGIFYSNIKDGKFVFNSYIPIPIDIINIYEDEKKQKQNLKFLAKDKLDYENLVLSSLEIDTKGNAIIIGEQFKEKEILINSGTPHSQLHKFFYNDVLVVKLSRDGALQWMSKIPKNQYGSSYQPIFYYRKKELIKNLSFRYFVNKNTISFFYWDLSSNLKLAKNDKPNEYINNDWGKLFCSELNYQTGEIEKRIILRPLNYMSDRGNSQLKNFNIPIENIVFVEDGVFLELKDFGKNKPKENFSIHILLK